MSERIRETQNRRRIEQLDEAVDREPAAVANGAEAVLLKTATKSVYPTVAGRYYYCLVSEVSGVPTEGAAATVTDTTRHVYAYNIGNAVPPLGTLVLGEQTGGRWTFRYNA